MSVCKNLFEDSFQSIFPLPFFFAKYPFKSDYLIKFPNCTIVLKSVDHMLNVRSHGLVELGLKQFH